MAERIGLQALFQDAQFRAGIANYNKSVVQATRTTDQGAQQITQSTQGIGQAWQSVGALVGGVISTYMVKQLGQAIFEMGRLGATVTRQKVAFEELAQQAGGSSNEILAAVQRATDGTVANSDIILAANKGILLGLGAQADQWEKLAEVARFRARAMGLSVTQALDDITTGIGRQSKLILDNLGIILDTEQVYADYAESINKTADALTDAEKKQAFLTTVIEEGQEQIAAAGGIARDTADDFEEFAAALKDAKEAIATWVAPQVAPIIGAIADAIPGAVIRLQLLTAAIQGVITMDEMWAAAAESQRIQMEQGDEAAQAYIEEVIRVGGAVEFATRVHGDWALSLKGSTGATEDATGATDRYTSAIYDAAEAQRQLEALVAGEQTAEVAEAAAEAAEELAKATEKAGKDRIRAQEQALRKMEQNEQSYANALSQLYDQIVATQKRAQEERLQEERDYAAAVLALDQRLAQDRADIERDRDRALAANRRKYNQKQEDAARDLNRDLADLEVDLAADNEATWAEYYATLESLAGQHGERMADLTEKHASERAAVEAKYEAEPPEDTIDERREALQEELKVIQEAREKAHGIASDREKELLAMLEDMKAEELAALEQAQGEEAAAEEAAYQAEQEKAAGRREEQLTANQAGYDEEIKQRNLAYERQLEDLKIAFQNEQTERQLAAGQALADLALHGEQERAQLEADHKARLIEIERGLAADTQAFTDAYNIQLRDLDTYLGQRLQKWRDYQAQVEAILQIGSPSRWMENIGKQMRAGLDAGFAAPSIATDLEGAVANFGKAATGKPAPSTAAPPPEDKEAKHKASRAIEEAISARPPAPAITPDWIAEEVAKFGRAANSLALPMGAGGGSSSVSNTTHNHNLQVSANYANMQNERSLRRDLANYDAMMRMRVAG